jgi:hypothetical protein
MEYAQVTYGCSWDRIRRPLTTSRGFADLAITAILNLQTDEDVAIAGLDWEPLEVHYGT